MKKFQPIDPNAFRAFEHNGWENAANPYHNYFASLTSQVIEPLLEVVQVKKNIRLLDVATGPGYVASAAMERGANAVGVDFSEAMLAEGRRHYPTVEFREGDAEALPFLDNSFDAVVINFGLLHFSQPEQALSEAYRTLCSGGRIGFTVWTKPEEAVGFAIVLGAIQTYGNLNVPLPPGPPFFHFSDPQECSNALLEVGFVSPTIVQISQTWRLNSPDALFDAFFEGTARTGPLLRAQSSEALIKIRTAILDAVKSYDKEGVIQIPMPAILASAVKP